jgi:WD40 repeat protein
VKTHQALGPPLQGHKKSVPSAAFSPYGKMLASGGVDGTVVLWNVASRCPLGSPVSGHRGEAVTAVPFRPDGKAVASVGGVRLNLWSVTERRTFGSPVVLDPIDCERRQSLGGGVDFSLDGKMLVTGGNGRIVLWDLASRQPLEPVLYGWGLIETTQLAMAPDGSFIAASNGNGLVLWDIGLASWQRRACRVANRDLTEEEWNKFFGPEVPYRLTCSELRGSQRPAAQ